MKNVKLEHLMDCYRQDFQKHVNFSLRWMDILER